MVTVSRQAFSRYRFFMLFWIVHQTKEEHHQENTEQFLNRVGSKAYHFFGTSKEKRGQPSKQNKAHLVLALQTS